MNMVPEEERSISKQNTLLFVGFGLLLAVLYDIFFWRKLTGVGFPIFIFISIIGSIALMVRCKLFREPKAIFFAALSFLFSLPPFLYQNYFAHTFVPVFSIVCLILFIAIAPIHIPKGIFFRFSSVPLIHSFLSLILKRSSEVLESILKGSEGSKGLAGRVGKGVLIALPILLLFGILFSHADPIFASWFQGINLDVSILWRIIRTFILTVIIASIWYEVMREKYTLDTTVEKPLLGDIVIVSVILGLVTTLFAIFDFVQIKYLFAGNEYVALKNLTYAEYARKGYAELMVAVALAGVIVLGVYKWFTSTGRHQALIILQTLLVFEVGIVAVSALFRLYLYQDAYGFTVSRLYGEWFVYGILSIMVWTIVSLVARLSFRQFWHGSLLLGTVALVLVSFVNADYTIAQKNINRFITEKTDQLDFYYLSNLSSDSVPAIPALVETARFRQALAKKNADAMRYEKFLTVMERTFIERKEITINNDDTESTIYPQRVSIFEYNLGFEQAKRVYSKEWRRVLPLTTEEQSQYSQFYAK